MAISHKILDAVNNGDGTFDVSIQVDAGDGPQVFGVTIRRDEIPLGRISPREFAIFQIRKFLTGTTLAAIKLQTETA